MSVLRIDRNQISKATKTPQGYLRAPAYATRVGVFEYRRQDGSKIREFRPPEEVFKADSLASLASIPVTNDHPAGGRLDVKNTKHHLVGYTGEVVKEDDFVVTTATITDDQTISQIEAGKAELSCGYTCDLEETSGEHGGERYDCVQRNITYNHLAIVARGRAGPNARLRLDAADAVLVDASDDTDSKGKTMKLKLDGKEFEVGDDVGAAVEAALEKARAAESTALSAMSTVKTKLDQAEARCDASTVEIERLKKDLKTRSDGADPAVISAKARERMALLKVGEALLPKELHEKLDSMDDRAIREAVIKADSAAAVLTGKSDDYVTARFDAIAEGLKGRGDGAEKVGAVLHKKRADGATDKVEEARQKMLEAHRNAWKPDFEKRA